MRPALISAVAVLLSGCILERAPRITRAATLLEPSCASVGYNIEEVEPWVWKVNCKPEPVWCHGADFEEMRCGRTRPETKESREERVARSYLWCPKGEITRERLWGDTDWAFFELTGCDRATWCGDHDGKWECRAPDALAIAVKQLAVETGCPAGQIAQVQRFATATQHTYRLAACGNDYSCIVPVMRPKDGRGRDTGDTAVASSNFGSLLTCKQVPKAVAPAPALPADLPPPPPP